MIIVAIFSSISFILESIISNMYSYNLLFSLISLVVLYPFFKNDDTMFYIYAFVFGLVYDLSYTDTIIFNASLFLLAAFLIKRINLMISNNAISVLLISFITIIYYRVLTFISLILVGYLPFNLALLFKSIINSIFLNLIYAFLIYIITDYFSKKYRILKID